MVEVVYKPRKPMASPLYQSISDHFSGFQSVYEQRYQKKYGVLRDVVREVVYKYLGCGDLRKGFARIKCGDCKHEVLLAFSCKGRYFCPSCNQKRVLMFGEWITENILYPLPHRQYVFTIPKMLRPYFRFDRKLLGKLSQCAYQSLKEFFQTTLNRKEAKPGVVISIQTFGGLINFHPHLHCLVTDGCFRPNGWFYVLILLRAVKTSIALRYYHVILNKGACSGWGGNGAVLQRPSHRGFSLAGRRQLVRQLIHLLQRRPSEHTRDVRCA